MCKIFKQIFIYECAHIKFGALNVLLICIALHAITFLGLRLSA